MTTNHSDLEALSFQAMLGTRNLLPYHLLCSAPVTSRYNISLDSMTLLMVYSQAMSQRTGLLPTIARTVSRMYRRTNSSRLRHKLRQLQELSPSSYLNPGSTVNSDSSSAIVSSSVEARLWFLTRSKLIEPCACRGLKSLSTSHKTSLESHEMLDESWDDARDGMLDANEAPIFETYGDEMELDEADELDLFQEHIIDGIVDEGEEFLDDNLLWKYSQDEVAYDGAEILDDTTSAVHDDSYAMLREFESGGDVVC